MKWFHNRKKSKLKCFLFNIDKKYSQLELICNWTIMICLCLIIIFLTLFSIETQNAPTPTLEQLNDFTLGQKANAYSFVAFMALISLLTSLTVKWTLKRKRNKKTREQNESKK